MVISLFLGSLDYQDFDNAVLTFDVSENRQCFEIGLIDDTILESDEFFTVMLAPTSDSVRVLISMDSCTVTIIDDDSKSIPSSPPILQVCMPFHSASNRCDSQLGTT